MWFLLFIIIVVAMWAVIRASGRKSERKQKRRPRKAIPQPHLQKSTMTRAPPVADARSRQAFVRPPQAESPEPAPINWHGTGSVLNVGGFRLRDACVYASTGGRLGLKPASDPSEILLNAEVRKPAGPVAEIGYWPWYSRIHPEHRFLYLDWLASGKTTLPAHEGLLFLYFYGIERRLLIDGQDKPWCLREIARLRQLDAHRVGSGAGGSFRMYSSGLLWFEVARTPDLFNDRAFRMVCDLTHSWNEPATNVALSWLVRHEKPLPVDLAFRIARMNPHAMRSVVTKRVGEQFDELFHKRYAERFGEGLRIKVSKRPCRHTYRPASAGLSEVACTIANPAGIPSQFKLIAEIWNSCVNDLRGFSKIATGSGSGPLTAQAWEAMPPELRADLDHPLASRVQEAVIAGEPSDDDVSTSVRLVPVASLAALLGLENRPRLTLAQSRRLAQTLQFTGYAVEPDARLVGRSYGWNDPVAVFVQTEGGEVHAPRYLGATCMLQLGLTIAEADGVVEPEELRHLSEHLDAVFQLPPHEKERLEALRVVLLKTGADLGAVSKRLETALSEEARRQVGRLLVAIAAASGSIDRKEETALRRCFRALALAPELLEQTIAEIVPADDRGLVTVGVDGERQPGEPIPAPGGLRLNREAISAIMAETREVALLLADAMATDEVEDNEGIPSMAPPSRSVESAGTELPLPAAPGGACDVPPARFASFFAALSAKSSWSRDEVEELARGHRVMPDGAIEALNEWALDRWGIPVIEEDGETLTIDRSLR